MCGKKEKPPLPKTVDEASSKIKYNTDVKSFRKKDALDAIDNHWKCERCNFGFNGYMWTRKSTWDKLVSIYEQSSG